MPGANGRTATLNEERLRRGLRWSGWLVLAFLLVAGVPLFVCMAPSWDATFYDLVARNMLSGGVHYRDTFDGNLPGAAWIHAATRWVAGWDFATLKMLDVLLLGGITWLLVRWVPAERKVARVWTAAGLVAFFLYLPENCHCQRDFWMLLPALGALSLRSAQVKRLAAGGSPWSAAPVALLEGILWGAAVWIKPFIAVPALAVWAASVVLVARNGGGAKGVSASTLGVLAGGLLAGGAGIAWLWASGTWPYFVEVVLKGNREYLGQSTSYLGLRLRFLLEHFVPRLGVWNLAIVAALCGAAVMLLRAGRTTGGKEVDEGTADRSGLEQPLLAAFFLGMFGQAVLIQHPHQYVFAATVPVAIGLVGAWAVLPGRNPAGWVAVVAFAAAAVFTHPLASAERLALWPRCLRDGNTPELRDRLSLVRGDLFGRADWRDLERIADFLREEGVEDGDVLCYHDSPHPLYLMLDVDPPVRYFHFSIVLAVYQHRVDEIREELNKCGARYVVSDLVGAGMPYRRAIQPRHPTPRRLPTDFPRELKTSFPWNEPVVFSAGRYTVHKFVRPVEEFDRLVRAKNR